MTHVREETALGAIGAVCGIPGDISCVLGDPQFAGSLRHLKFQPGGCEMQAPYPPSVGRECQTRHAEEDDAPERPCRPPWRLHGDFEVDALLVPDSVIIGALDSKSVFAGRKTRIGGQAMPAVHFVPISFKWFQSIPVPVVLGSEIAQGGELQC